MTKTAGSREERIELRATRDEKRLLAAAAAEERLDVTSFVLRAALPAAREVMSRADRIVLSARDTDRVLALLENPPEPAPALVEAARRNKRAVQVGMTGSFQVLSVDPDKKRIGVALVPEGTTTASLAADAAEQAEATSRATATQVAGFGSLADKLRDALKPR